MAFSTVRLGLEKVTSGHCYSIAFEKLHLLSGTQRINPVQSA